MTRNSFYPQRAMQFNGRMRQDTSCVIYGHVIPLFRGVEQSTSKSFVESLLSLNMRCAPSRPLLSAKKSSSIANKRIPA
jgi:hypothetical protein